ncbi:hypothetical protein [Rhizobium sp. NFR03]|uniref:hypothetical protein n=1 Tax=Rhizobium sp. NFR03 TaxID=1566263 RepID=UPI0008B8A191|nr:hypothetical protein [Rhizobium sp. NFR03]SES05326.1 hypothetical protein SAMN03159406_01946 [Rhizobium sp. NFR03]
MTDRQVDYRKDLTGADKVAADAKAMAAAAKTTATEAAELAASVDKSMKAAALVWEYTFTVTQALTISLAPATQRFLASAAKAELGDLVFIHPAGRPTVGGVTLGSLVLQATGFVSAKGIVDVNYMLPPLTVAGALSMPIRLRGFRPPVS